MNENWRELLQCLVDEHAEELAKHGHPAIHGRTLLDYARYWLEKPGAPRRALEQVTTRCCAMIRVRVETLAKK